MDIDAIFEKNNSFTARVEVQIPGKKADKVYSLLAEYRYLSQETIDSLIEGEPVDIDGRTISADDEDSNDARVLDAVLIGWSDFKVGDEEIEYSDSNREQALRHAPIRTPMVTKFFARLQGVGQDGGKGGKRGKRKTS